MLARHCQDDMKHFFGKGIPIEIIICHYYLGHTQHIQQGSPSDQALLLGNSGNAQKMELRRYISALQDNDTELFFFPTRWAPASYKRIITPLTGVIFHTSYPFIFVHWYGLYINITPFRTIVMGLTLNSLAHFLCSSNAGLSLVLFQYGHLACGGSQRVFRDGVER